MTTNHRAECAWHPSPPTFSSRWQSFAFICFQMCDCALVPVPLSCCCAARTSWSHQLHTSWRSARSYSASSTVCQSCVHGLLLFCLHGLNMTLFIQMISCLVSTMPPATLQLASESLLHLLLFSSSHSWMCSGCKWFGLTLSPEPESLSVFYLWQAK